MSFVVLVCKSALRNRNMLSLFTHMQVRRKIILYALKDQSWIEDQVELRVWCDWHDVCVVGMEGRAVGPTFATTTAMRTDLPHPTDNNTLTSLQPACHVLRGVVMA